MTIHHDIAPRAVLVVYDGSRRAERVLAHGLALCRDTRARLGLALIQERVVLLNSPWVCVAASVHDGDVCDGVLRRLPDDLSVSFLSSSRPTGVREIAEFAKRLDCDSVLLPYSGWRARRAARILARGDVAVLVDADGEQPLRPRLRAIGPPPHQVDPLGLAMPVALVPISPHRPNP